jgi:hypothetical protein
MPAYAVDLLGDVRGRRVLILGVAYRGGVKETAFSGAFACATSSRPAAPIPSPQDPLYAADELADLGYNPWDGGTIDAVLVQADHAAYAALGPGDLPARAWWSTAAGSSIRRRSPPRASPSGGSAGPEQRLDDAPAGLAVAVELGALGSARALERRERRGDVQVDEDVPARVHRLGPLGRVAQRHARHSGEVRLLLHPAESVSIARARVSSAVNAR